MNCIWQMSAMAACIESKALQLSQQLLTEIEAAFLSRLKAGRHRYSIFLQSSRQNLYELDPRASTFSTVSIGIR